VKPLNIPQNSTTGMSHQTPQQILQYYFLNMRSWYRNPFFNSHWSVWFDYSQHPSSPRSTTLFLCNAHMHNVSIFTPICQSAGSWHKTSPAFSLGNTAGSEKCANCSLL